MLHGVQTVLRNFFQRTHVSFPCLTGEGLLPQDTPELQLQCIPYLIEDSSILCWWFLQILVPVNT